MVVIGFIGVGVVILLLILLIVLVINSIKLAGNKRKQMKENNITAQSAIYHVEGLPLAEKSLCQVSVSHNGLIIGNGGVEYNISVDQLVAAEVKTDTEIANIVHSSAVKGIAGGLLFGPIGLVVGSRATNKAKRSHTYYLVINYVNSEGELAPLLFTSENSPLPVMKIVNKLTPLIRENPKKVIQL